MSILPENDCEVKRQAGEPGRLDTTENNSKSSSEPLSVRVSSARVKARRNVAWQEGRRLLNVETGELLTDEEGNELTLADVGKSWYTPKGVKRQAVAMIKRVARSEQFGRRYKPVFLTLTVDGRCVNGSMQRAWEVVGQELNRLLTNLRQHVNKFYGIKIAYFWSLEAHPDPEKPHYGWPHYHIVILGMPYINKEKLAAWWGLGFIKVKLLDGLSGVVRYMAKYMWKAVELMLDDETSLDSLPDWWFYFRVFKRRRFGFSRFYHLPALERVPAWLRREIENIGIGDQVTGVERVPGEGWRVWFFADEREEGAACWVRASPWRIVA